MQRKRTIDAEIPAPVRQTQSTASAPEPVQKEDGGSTIRRNINTSTNGVSESEYKSLLKNMYTKRVADFNQTTQPVIDTLYEDTKSTEIIDRAEVEASQLADRSKTTQRHVQDYDMGSLLPSQRAAQARQNSMATTKAGTAIRTKGEIDQVAQRQAARTQLLGMAEQLQSSGTASISSAMQAKRQRDAAYEQAKAQHGSQIGSIAGAAVGAIGGPAGMAIGASLGGAAGGMMA